MFNVLKQNAQQEWIDYTHHRFVNQIHDGNLDVDVFKFYLMQDYLFLLEYAKTWAYVISVADTKENMDFGYSHMKAILETEIQCHMEYCEKWGVSVADLQNVTAHKDTTAYTDFVAECAKKYGYVGGVLAMAPCTIGYAEIGARLAKNPIAKNMQNVKPNPYQSWIDMYGNDEMANLAQCYKTHLESVLRSLYPHNAPLYDEIFKTAVILEVKFWEMPYSIK